MSEARFFLFDRVILCHFTLHCQKLVKSVPSKSHSVKGMTRSSLGGEESIWPLVSVTLTLMVVHQPWRRNELFSFGGDPLNYKKKKNNITSGWCLTETGKLSKLLKICTCWIESYYIGLYWPCPKENMDAPFELKSKDKGKLKYGKPIGGAEGSLIQK